MPDAMIRAEGLVKIYKTKQTEVLALQGLDLQVDTGELTAIIGNSGSGKSTFLNMIGGLDRPSAGSLFVAGSNLFTMTEKELVRYKRETVGFVWQNNGRNLVPYLSVLENVMLPMNLSGTRKKKEKALQLLEMVGMSAKKHSRMNMMSGGEQQRIAIAIALANSPKLLLADEPTGSVDMKTANYIFDVFTELNRNGQTILIVTHDVALCCHGISLRNLSAAGARGIVGTIVSAWKGASLPQARTPTINGQPEARGNHAGRGRRPEAHAVSLCGAGPGRGLSLDVLAHSKRAGAHRLGAQRVRRQRNLRAAGHGRADWRVLLAAGGHDAPVRPLRHRLSRGRGRRRRREGLPRQVLGEAQAEAERTGPWVNAGRADGAYKKTRSETLGLRPRRLLVAGKGVEPLTRGFSVPCSTN